jgi:hypothetical protein
MTTLATSLPTHLLCALLIASSSAVSQAKVACDACRSVGSFPCKKHKKIIELEKNVEFCSVASACTTCDGAYRIDCKICSNATVENAAAARKALVKRWFQNRREQVETITKSKGILHASSKHFDLTFSIAPMRVGKNRRPVPQHRLMHIWIDRMEAEYADFCSVFEVTDKDFAVKVDLYMFEKRVDHVAIAPRKVGSDAGKASGKKYMGDKMIFTMWRLPREMRNDDDMQRYMSHHIAHLFVNHMAPNTWIFNKGHGWIDAGIAHWFEYKASARVTNYCYEEVALEPGAGWKNGKWKSAMRQLVETGKQVPFRKFFLLNTDSLSPVAHAMSFAYVDFLVSTRGGGKMRDLIRAVKNKTPTRDALKTIYGLTPLSIEAPFAAWVKKTYPRREKSRRR